MELLSTIINFYEKPEFNSKEKYIEAFKLPIEYLDSSSLFTINNNITNDLELVKANSMNELSKTNNTNNSTLDSSDNNYNLYYHVFGPKTIFEKNVINKWSKYYTNDKQFLLDTQDLIKNYKPLKKVEFIDDAILCKNNDKEFNVYNNCQKIIYDKAFVSNYQYIDIPLLNKFNNNSIVLQALSIYNLSTPVISLLIPILFLLLPFFIIKLL